MDRYRIRDTDTFGLSAFDPTETVAFEGGKAEARFELDALSRRLESLQELLWAQRRHKVLVVLQGMDTSGKDAVIRRVFDGVNPQGVRVSSFGVPTEEELAHDYLWRVHEKVPGKGQIGIFNRSHYEDVLVVRVHGLVPEDAWRRRYDHIRTFERLLADEGTTVVKFFLHISKAEQKKRLQERLDDAAKRWKFKKGDLAERARWDEYMAAFQDAIAETSTPEAPWYVIPSDHGWYRDWLVSTALVSTLESLDMRYPEPEEDLTGVVVG